MPAGVSCGFLKRDTNYTYMKVGESSALVQFSDEQELFDGFVK